MQCLGHYLCGNIYGMFDRIICMSVTSDFFIIHFLKCLTSKIQFKLTGSFVFSFRKLMALLLLRHALMITDADTDGDDDTSTFFSVSEIQTSWALFYHIKCVFPSLRILSHLSFNLLD